MHVATRRLTLIRNTVSMLQTMRSELPASADLIATTIHGLLKISDRYEQRAKDLNLLADAERKPPMKRGRVPTSKPAGGGKKRRGPRASNDSSESSNLVYVPGHGVEKHATVTACRSCGCPEGSNRDCPTCYPMDVSNVEEENQG